MTFAPDNLTDRDIYNALRKSYRKKKKTRMVKDKLKDEQRLILSSADYSQKRWELYLAAEGRCTIPWRDGKIAKTESGDLDFENGRACGRSAPYYPGSEWSHFGGQACHWPPKKMGNGFGSDDRMYWGCGNCHDVLDGRNQKVVPAKEKA